MNKLEVGSYVKYRGRYYVAVKVGTDWVRILNIKRNNSWSVMQSSVTVQPWICHKVLSDSKDKYLVTLKDHIVISLVNNKVTTCEKKAKEILAHIV